MFLIIVSPLSGRFKAERLYLSLFYIDDLIFFIFDQLKTTSPTLQIGTHTPADWRLRGEVSLLEIVFVGQCEVRVCL